MAKLFFFILFFCLGFLAHALIFPNTLVSTTVNFEELLTKQNLTNTKKVSDTFLLENKVFYTGDTFQPSRVIMHTGDYIEIINQNKTKYMELLSDNPTLNTPRPYGYTEQIRTVLTSPGSYTIFDKLNKSVSVVIIVIAPQ